MKNRKKVYSTKNVVSSIYDDARQTSIFSAFAPENTPLSRKNQYFILLSL